MTHVGEVEAAPMASARPNGRVVRRRAGLPGGRALFGALLVTAAGVGLFAAYQRAAAGPQRAYAVARHDVTIGSRLRRGDVVMQTMDLAPSVRVRAFPSADAVVGTTVLAPIAAGELIQRGALARVAGGTADREVTLPIERTRLLSGLREGERVDILVTYGTAVDAYTITAVRQAVVVRVERARGSLGDSSVVLVTVALGRSSDAVAVAHGSRAGLVTLVRANSSASQDAPIYRSPPPAPVP